MFHEHLTSFYGKQVVDFPVGGALADPATTVPRLRVDFEVEETATTLLAEVLAQPKADQLTALVIGAWSGALYDDPPSEIIEALVAAADQLPNLRALVIGDITYEENEVSWIHQCEVSALWAAFPRLEVLHIRGSQGLSLGRPSHAALKTLIIECGGLPANVLHELSQASFPSLEHLELYLGTERYGWNGTIADVQALLQANRFPKLRYLGLRDSEIADEVAQAVAQASLPANLEVLDLSLGTLGDAGAEALLAAPFIKKLKKLDLHYHYFSDGMKQQLAALPIEVDLDEEQGENDDRYVSVGE